MSGITFGDHYEITDIRFVHQGVNYARVFDKSDDEKLGSVGYFSAEGPDESAFFSMLVAFDVDTQVFYVFSGSNTDMYGRYWLLGEGDEPGGRGAYFRGAVDTFQAVDSSSQDGGVNAIPESRTNTVEISASGELEKLEYDNAGPQLEPMFSGAAVRSALEQLRQANRSNNE